MPQSRIAMPHRQMSRHAVALVPLLLLACDAPPPGDGSADAPAVQERGAAADTALTDTLMIEGQPQPIRYTHWSAPAGYPLRFSTRLPQRVRPADEGQGALRFEFDTQNADSAFLRVVALPEGIDEQRARGLLRAVGTDFGVIGSQGLEIDEAPAPQQYAWSLLSYRLQGVVRDRPVDGILALGRHDGRYFHVMQLFPPEYADGVAPRFDYVLRHWRWADGSPLTRQVQVPEVVDADPTLDPTYTPPVSPER